MSDPLVTVITVCYNAEKSISQTIQSVLGQTWPLVEYIVIDGGSTDNTMSVVKSFQNAFIGKGYQFYYISEIDNGIYDAMNKGIAMANGCWINFMNAGDSFFSDQVIESIFSREIPNDAQIVYGDVSLVLKFGAVQMTPKPIDYLKKKMAFCHQSAFVKSDEMKAHPFDLRYRLAADYDFFYQCYCRGCHFFYRPITVASFESEDGASSQSRLTVNREYAQIHGVESTWSWKLWFIWKCFRVNFKKYLYLLLPVFIVSGMRKNNYKRLVKRRRQNG